MKNLRTLFGTCVAFSASLCAAQSDGGRFDAAVVLTPGMALQRGQAHVVGGYQSALLQHGDVIRTDNWMRGSYHILTSDGTVIGIASASTVAIDARQIGFDVFRVLSGSANILGNVNNGYPMPLELRMYRPFRTGNVTIFPDPDPFVPFPDSGNRIVFPIIRRP